MAGAAPSFYPLTCGLKLISEHGYDTTTAQDIVQAVGVSTMTFFRHFLSKEDVVLGMSPDSNAIIAAAEALKSSSKDLYPVKLPMLFYRWL
ncbi:transcriptional regulator [Cryptobacterium curtum DSM 15641]|uniref:Transcriptional regulator n=1 Tax=Cryptobacterium curtum (strain ATCC 700683 / DSM 15641 / CCUG 43107 / 12-3) TaxID=469378 RepID=C7MMZ1_CRYCD|nr:transcriptional regulator [Cryptobacterium curtum DSM 15641]